MPASEGSTTEALAKAGGTSASSPSQRWWKTTPASAKPWCRRNRRTRGWAASQPAQSGAAPSATAASSA